MPEAQYDDSEDRIAADGYQTLSLLERTNCSFVAPRMKVIRLGEFVIGKNRPIKLIMEASDQVHTVVKSAEMLKKYAKY
ncbi:hypothetical protein JTB14_035814 [Gonioctena quinquepunctata]|nr:hypothetical protein JTB14_035814 [Gonioctena quinquepunctata]